MAFTPRVETPVPVNIPLTGKLELSELPLDTVTA
jgi:hypothetical protein